MQKFYTFSNLSKQEQVMHLVTKKESFLPYSFSLALHTGENPEEIINNRMKIEQWLGNNSSLKFVVANQTHSNNVKVIDNNKEYGWHTMQDAIEDCDALITNVPNTVLTILTADCVPILLYDKKCNIVAAIHAGWKGTAANIVKETINTMIKEFNINPQNLLAAIAPSIGKCCYEVDFNVAQHFLEYEDAFTKNKNKYMLDLPHINLQQLLKMGLKIENIEQSNICTSCNVDEYFSYRKESGCSGRFMSIIGLKDINET